jgi:hypothetical protein
MVKLISVLLFCGVILCGCASNQSVSRSHQVPQFSHNKRVVLHKNFYKHRDFSRRDHNKVWNKISPNGNHGERFNRPTPFVGPKEGIRPSRDIPVPEKK